MSRIESEETHVGLTGPASPGLGHDFRRISVHPTTTIAIQAKPRINEPGDEFEREADRVSDRVMRMEEPRIQRRCACGGSCEDCQDGGPGATPEGVQLKRIGGGERRQAEAPPIVHEVTGSPGRPLDAEARAFMEPRFGHDFRHVRVHADEKAAESAESIAALAYTMGRHIVFGAGRYEPSTASGRGLLAHELAHVIQQGRDLGRNGGNVAHGSTPRADGPMIQRFVPEAVDLPEEDTTGKTQEDRDEEPDGENSSEPDAGKPGGKRPPRPRGRDKGANTNWRGVPKQVDAWNHARSLERPQATVDPGGTSPDFITEGKTVPNTPSYGEGGSIPSYTPRYFHILDAIDHDVAIAANPAEIKALQGAYFPEVFFKKGEAFSVLMAVNQPGLPDKAAVRGLDYGLDDPDRTIGARVRQFRVAMERREMREAEQVALTSKGKRRIEGACRNKKNPPKSSGGTSSDYHNRYATHVANTQGYGNVTDELTWTTPEGVSYSFDTYNPTNENEVWEVKTQHAWASPLGMSHAPHSVKEFEERFLGLEEQRLTGLYIADRCGLRFRYAFDNFEAYTGFSQLWLLPPLAYIPYPGDSK